MRQFGCMADQVALKTAAIRVGMKLEGKHVRANGERLIAAHLRGREPFRSCGKIKGVAMLVLYQFIVGMPLRKISSSTEGVPAHQPRENSTRCAEMFAGRCAPAGAF